MAHSIVALRQESDALLKHSRKLREDAGEARARSAKIREAAQRAQLSTCNRQAHAEVVLRRQDRDQQHLIPWRPHRLALSTQPLRRRMSKRPWQPLRIKSLVRERPGITSEELRRALGTDVDRALRRLEQVRYVRRVRSRRNRAYYYPIAYE
jgi:hypothetical protein